MAYTAVGKPYIFVVFHSLTRAKKTTLDKNVIFENVK